MLEYELSAICNIFALYFWKCRFYNVDIMRIGALRMTTKLHKYSTLFKRMLPPAIWQPARALLTGIITPIRFSQKTGHWKSSLRMFACSSDGTPIPWYTYPAIDF